MGQTLPSATLTVPACRVLCLCRLPRPSVTKKLSLFLSQTCPPLEFWIPPPSPSQGLGFCGYFSPPPPYSLFIHSYQHLNTLTSPGSPVSGVSLSASFSSSSPKADCPGLRLDCPRFPHCPSVPDLLQPRGFESHQCADDARSCITSLDLFLQFRTCIFLRTRYICVGD